MIISKSDDLRKPDKGLFTMEITKAEGETNSEGIITKMVIKGVASNTQRDKEDHMVTVEGLESIKSAIERGIIDEDGEWSPVPLRSGHREEWEDKLGDIVKAEIDDDQNLWIVAELDVDSSKARDLYVKISKGNKHGRKPQLGLSVKGKATKYRFGSDPDSGARITYLEQLTIDEVSVTSRPKNPTRYPLAIYKSLIANSTEVDMENETNESGLSEKVSIHASKNDPIAQAVQKAHEASQANVESTEPAVAYSDGTEHTAQDADNATANAEAQAEEHVEETAVAYTAHPATTTESETAQEAAAQQAVDTQPAPQADPVASVATAVEQLTNVVSQLRADVEQLRNSNAPQVQKSETSVTPAPKSDDVAPAAVTTALEALLKPLVDEIRVVKSELSDLRSQPNDRSFAVSKAKDSEDSNDPMVRMRALKEKGFDPIAAAAAAAYNER